MTIKPDLVNENNGARTSDWISQTAGNLIFAPSLDAGLDTHRASQPLLSEMLESEELLHRTLEGLEDIDQGHFDSLSK
jgi:hypothetical protein